MKKQANDDTISFNQMQQFLHKNQNLVKDIDKDSAKVWYNQHIVVISSLHII